MNSVQDKILPLLKKKFVYKFVPAAFASGLAVFGLSACGEDPSSPDTPEPTSTTSQDPIENSSDTPLTSPRFTVVLSVTAHCLRASQSQTKLL